MYDFQAHFSEEMWRKTPDGKRLLISAAVPTIFPRHTCKKHEPTSNSHKETNSASLSMQDTSVKGNYTVDIVLSSFNNVRQTTIQASCVYLCL